MGDPPLLDVPALARRLRLVAGGMVVVAAIGLLVEVVLGGSVLAAVMRWAGGTVALALVVTVGLVAAQAYRAADTAQRRGQRLSSDGVGLVPPRRRGGPFRRDDETGTGAAG